MIKAQTSVGHPSGWCNGMKDVKDDYTTSARQLVGLHGIKPLAFVAVRSAYYNDLATEISSGDSVSCWESPELHYEPVDRRFPIIKKGTNSPANISRNFLRPFLGNIESRAKQIPPSPFYTTSLS